MDDVAKIVETIFYHLRPALLLR